MTFVVRPFRPDADLVALVDLVNTAEAAEGREPSLTVERLESLLAVPGLYRWVAVAPDEPARLAGYGVVFHQMPQRCYGDVRVHPGLRRRGVGRRLIDPMVQKAADVGARYLTIDVDAANQDALRFLLSQGFRFRGDVWALVAPPAVALPQPAWPGGYSVATYADSPDLSGYVGLCNRTFGDMWGHWENFPGAMDEARVIEILEQFSPAGIFIVRDSAGNAVAQCRAKAAADDTSPHILDQPGVIPAAREAGLHRPLALTAAHWLLAQGARPIRLESWGDSAATIAVYEALGFERVEHEVSYARELGD